MAVDTVVTNAKIVNPWGTYSGDIVIDEGKIVGIRHDSGPIQADRTIDAKGKHVIAGVLDPHVHFNQGAGMPDLTATETRALQTETASAAAGGVTTVMTMQYTGGSYFDIFDRTMKTIKQKSMVDVVLNAGIFTERQVEEIPRYANELGITGYKWLMPYREKEARTLGLVNEKGVDDALLWWGLQQVAKVGYPAIAMIHAENVEIIARLSERLRAQGRDDLQAYWDARPRFAEKEYMLRSVYFSGLSKARIYIVHISIGEGPGVIAEAKARNIPVFGETCSHYLNLTQKDALKFGNLAKLNPPLRDAEDVNGLWEGIRSGAIDCVGTDHCSHTKASKNKLPSIWESYPGFPGVATLLPVMLSDGVNGGRISMQKLTEVLSYRTAGIFGLRPRKGSIELGSDADLTMVDLDKHVRVTPELLKSESDYTLYDGRIFNGWPTMTMVRGNIVMEEGEIVGKPGTGEYVPRVLPGRQSKSPATWLP